MNKYHIYDDCVNYYLAHDTIYSQREFEDLCKSINKDSNLSIFKLTGILIREYGFREYEDDVIAEFCIGYDNVFY